MSLGSRIGRRGKVAIVTSLASAPREPLLFLYPPWISKSSFTTSAPVSQAHKNPSISALSKDTLASNVGIGKPVLRTLKTSSHITGKRFEHNVPSQQDVRAESERIPTGQNGNESSKPLVGPVLLGAGYNLPAPPPSRILRKVYSCLTKRARIVQHRRNTRNAYRENLRKQQLSADPDWRSIMADLRDRSPKYERWLEKALNIQVPESVVGRFLLEVDDNMWDIASRYGCSIELSSQASPETGDRYYVLSGTATAIRRTAADILAIAPQVGLSSTQTGLLPSSITMKTTPAIMDSVQLGHDGTARQVRSENRQPIQVLKATDIPRPMTWTRESFADYVSDLTSLVVPNHMHRLLYNRYADHVSTVIKILREVFLEAERHLAVSRYAFNKALGYFEKTSQIAAVREFFVRMEMMRVPADVETFNIMLRGTAKNEDLHNFHFILHLMFRRGVMPNFGTWIAFMMAVPHLRIKLYILQTMNERGLLGLIAARRSVCQELVTQEMSASLDHGQREEEFLKHMDTNYGSWWLTLSSANRIVNVLGSRGLISRCWDFLSVMESRLITPNQVTINTILNHCKQSGNMNGALEVVRRLPQSISFVPNEITYNILFEMAWRGMHYNLCKVIWKYACLNAATTRMMRSRVLTSLRIVELDRFPAITPCQRWNLTAGAFVSGIHRSRFHPMRASHEALFQNEQIEVKMEPEVPYQPIIDVPGTKELNRSQKSPPIPYNNLVDRLEELWTAITQKHDILEGESSSGNPSRARLAAAGTFLEYDYQVFKDWRQIRSFQDLLKQAATLDQKWVDDPSLNFTQKLLDGIFVPIQLKGQDCEYLYKEWN